MVSLTTGVAAISLQTVALQITPIRRMLNIPVVPANVRGRIPTFRESGQFLVKWFKDQQQAAKASNDPKPRRR